LLRYKLRAVFSHWAMRMQMPLIVRFRGGIATGANGQDRRDHDEHADPRTHYWLGHIGDFGPP
jgi:hypothetical protein